MFSWVRDVRAPVRSEVNHRARVPLACLPACAEVRVQRKCKACARPSADDTATGGITSLECVITNGFWAMSV